MLRREDAAMSEKWIYGAVALLYFAAFTEIFVLGW